MKDLYFNGKVYIKKGEFKEAFIVEDGLFKDIGDNEELLKLDNIDNKIDLNGQIVLPGLNDSHLHLLSIGEGLNQVNIEDVNSIDEMILRCREFIKENPQRVKNGLHSVGWNQDNFKDSERLPNRHDLDKISTDIPIVLERVCGHIVSSNTKIIEMLGFNKENNNFENSNINIDEVMFEGDGYPLGIYRANACNYAKDLIPDTSADEKKQMLIEALNQAVSFGLTSVQSNDIGTIIMDTDLGLQILEKIYAENLAPIRYRHQICFNILDDFKKYIDKGIFKKDYYKKDSKLTIGPLKLFKDGSLGARTALMKNGYIGDPDNHGVEWMSDDTMRSFVNLAKNNNIQVVTHVIGDKAIDDTINCYMDNFIEGENKLRHSLIHCQITDDYLINKIVDNDINVMAQPIFIDYDMDIVESLCGKELSSTSYAFGTLIRKGAHLSLGTDAPVESSNPFVNIYEAVTRKNRLGEPKEGFYKEHALSLEEAIDAYTIGSAYAEFMENIKGRIKENYYADFTVIKEDIFEIDEMKIKDILPTMTIVGGNVEYEK